MPDSQSKILVVDDDDVVLMLMKSLLRSRGIKCLQAESVRVAMTILENETPDIILSDYRMGGKDGFEFREELLADKRWKHIPFVFFTSFADEEFTERGLDLQALDYIDKSVPFPLVVQKLVNILDAVRKQHEQAVYQIGATARALNLRSVPARVPDNRWYKFDFLYETFENNPGGDFIDFIEPDKEHTFVIMGDVMGKKWGAWFFSFNYLSYIRSAIRLCVFDGDLSTASIVNKINRVVNQDPVLQDVLSTLSLLMIEHKTGRITYTGAGDLPLLLFTEKDRECRQIQSSGLLLGIMADGLYEEQVIEMQTGDQLLIISDGMTDFRGQSGDKSSYPGFINRVKFALGQKNTLALIRTDIFTHQDDFRAVDDRSLLLIEKKSL